MIYTYKHTKGLPVVTLAEGKKVGSVDELFIEPDRKYLEWLKLDTGSLFGEWGWISTNAIHDIGEHAVTINGEGDIRKAAQARAAQQLEEAGRSIIGKTVVTETGNKLGTVTDYVFGPTDCRLLSLIVPSKEPTLFGGASELNAMSTENVLTIGKDLIVVSAQAEREFVQDQVERMNQ